jgi:NADH-quinone oxidoreductase subunit J
MAPLFFGYFSGVIALTAVLVVALKNPIYSALSLLVLFFHVAGLYVTLHAEVLAAVQIIVYAGAILVLYLFVVMLLNIKREERYHGQWRIVGFVCIPLLLETMVLLAGSSIAGQSNRAPLPTELPVENGSLAAGNTQAIGETLFSTYLFPFEVASLILLVAMIGAIILAKRDIGGSEA